MIQPKLNKRKCMLKSCDVKFQKKYFSDQFCSIDCANKYKNQKQAKYKAKVSAKKIAGEPKESLIFQEIWESKLPNERVSFVTGKVLSDNINARAWYFSHVLPKGGGKYPMFKYYHKNIVLKEFTEHEIWEYKQYTIKDNPLWQHVFRLKEKLIEEYEEHLKLFEQGYVEYYKID